MKAKGPINDKITAHNKQAAEDKIAIACVGTRRVRYFTRHGKWSFREYEAQLFDRPTAGLVMREIMANENIFPYCRFVRIDKRFGVNGFPTFMGT